MLEKLVWPIFWIIIIFSFKNEIKAIFSTVINIGHRSKKISYMGLNVDLGTHQDIPMGSQLTEEKQKNITKAFQSPIITTEENIIRSQLIDAGFTNEQVINTLIYHLANANLFIKLLSIDKLIFLEQIDLLSYLNTQFKPVSESNLQNFYDKWKEKNLTSNYTFQQFLNFLYNQRLLISQLDGYLITSMGKEYLSFLIKIGRPIS